MPTTHSVPLHKNTRLLQMLAQIIGDYLRVTDIILISNKRNVEYKVFSSGSDIILSFLDVLTSGEKMKDYTKDVAVKLYFNDLLSKDTHIGEEKYRELIGRAEEALNKFGYFLANVEETDLIKVAFGRNYKFSPGIFEIEKKNSETSYQVYLFRMNLEKRNLDVLANSNFVNTITFFVKKETNGRQPTAVESLQINNSTLKKTRKGSVSKFLYKLFAEGRQSFNTKKERENKLNSLANEGGLLKSFGLKRGEIMGLFKKEEQNGRYFLSLVNRELCREVEL